MKKNISPRASSQNGAVRIACDAVKPPSSSAPSALSDPAAPSGAMPSSDGRSRTISSAASPCTTKISAALTTIDAGQPPRPSTAASTGSMAAPPSPKPTVTTPSAACRLRANQRVSSQLYGIGMSNDRAALTSPQPTRSCHSSDAAAVASTASGNATLPASSAPRAPCRSM